jgi:uncharacterized protein YjiS (DUF1127 family)
MGDTTMRAPSPALPLSPATRLRLAFLTVGDWLKAFARARRNRRQAARLAQLDGRMLTDIGISRADLRDAFSEPFWEDPTALLRERALERRWSRALAREGAFGRLGADRPPRETM